MREIISVNTDSRKDAFCLVWPPWVPISHFIIDNIHCLLYFKNHEKKKKRTMNRDFPGCPAVKTMLPLQGA